MKKRIITKTVTEVVCTEYTAEDGTIFTNEEECKKYEESALFVVSRKLKRIADCAPSDIHCDFNCDTRLEIFDVSTQEDIDNLKRYLYLTMQKNGAREEDIFECLENPSKGREQFVFSDITYGHEVMVFWSWEQNWCWTYNDGSMKGLSEYMLSNYEKILRKAGESNEH